MDPAHMCEAVSGDQMFLSYFEEVRHFCLDNLIYK